MGRWCITGERFAGEEPNGRDECLLSGVAAFELVAGLDIGEDKDLALPLISAKSPTFRFLEVGRRGVEVSGLPKASPVAAIPTVLEATSYRN